MSWIRCIKELWSFFNTIGGINMLSLEKVKNELKTFGYEYANNILCDILNLR